MHKNLNVLIVCKWPMSEQQYGYILIIQLIYILTIIVFGLVTTYHFTPYSASGPNAINAKLEVSTEDNAY